jgi:hypothetical protein
VLWGPAAGPQVSGVVFSDYQFCQPFVQDVYPIRE